MFEIGATMQRIDSLINELKTIMQDNAITPTKVVSVLDGKCARNTILSFFSKGDADPKLSTLLMILDACGVELRLETERSKEAIMSGDIASYRADLEQIRTELDKAKADSEFYRSRYEEVSEKNTALTRMVEKQQNQIDRYIDRMEKAEEAIYRKDARIVELSKLCNKW